MDRQEYHTDGKLHIKLKLEIFLKNHAIHHAVQMYFNTGTLKLNKIHN